MEGQKKLKFRISTALKDIIGKDLITNEQIAIFELVKNSFDAYSPEVNIIFQNIFSSQARIIIEDYGKGMSLSDIEAKWLFVAFSAKKDNTEDKNYRSNINRKPYYAGAKGIGRFSCDKLGKKLRLITKKENNNEKAIVVELNWEAFEQSQYEEFASIEINQYFLDEMPNNTKHGTILEISDLRNPEFWTRKNILDLKRSLSKLINPFDSTNENRYKINIEAKDFIIEDTNEANPASRLNGPVVNTILGLLDIKTTKITSFVSEDGKEIETELSDSGVWIYKIRERNIYPKIHNLIIELYFLNQSAKANFSRKMGVRPAEFGNIFVYKNGFRVFPYGEPDLDPFGLDVRQSKRIGDYVGNRDLIGRIEIFGDNSEFKETTSRGDGLIKNESYYQLYDFFINKTLVRLENFRKNVTRFGFDFEYLSNAKNNPLNVFRYLANEFNNNEIIDVKLNDQLFEILKEADSNINNTRNLFRRIHEIANEKDNLELRSYLNKIEQQIEETIQFAKETESTNQQIEKELIEKNRENIFLKSIRSDKQLVSLMHHIGVFSNNISLDVDYLLHKILKGDTINLEELRLLLEQIRLENQKIYTVSKVATSANTRINANEQKIDLIKFIVDYVENISKLTTNGVAINVVYDINNSFETVFRPIELMIVIDNLINNSEKARSKKINIILEIKDINTLLVHFQDDGIGISKDNADKIFDFGFTTTSGSGIGLNHVKEVLSKINAKIQLNQDSPDGAEFLLTFKKLNK